MMLIDQLHSDLINAQKNGDTAKVSVLRYLTAGIKNREIELRYLQNTGKGKADAFLPTGELADSEVLAAIQKQVKEHIDSIEAYKKGAREDLVHKESTELAILESYLPAQMAEEDIKAEVARLVADLPASDQKNFGLAMRAAMVQLKGRADGGVVQRIVKEVIGR